MALLRFKILLQILFYFIYLLSVPVLADNLQDEILIISSHNEISYRLANQLKSTLGKKLKKTHINITVIDNGKLYPTKAPATAGYKLVITIGTDAAVRTLENDIPGPVYCILIPRSTFELISQSTEFNRHKTKAGTLAAIYLDQPLGKYINLLSRLDDDIRTIGLFIDESNSIIVKEYKKSNPSKKRNIVVGRLDQAGVPANIIEDVVKKSDGIIILPGESINNFSSKWILQIAYKHMTPVIGYSEKFSAAGALAALYTDIDKMLNEASEKLYKYLSDEFAVLESGYPSNSLTTFNKSVARFLNIELPVDGVSP